MFQRPITTAIAVTMLTIADPSIGVTATTCWLPPVDAPVVDPFREPECAWCPGNRGIEYATVPGTPVRSVAAGEVSFAGTVAGTVYVVVRHADGRRVTYGRLAERSVGRGDRVVAGSIVGRTTDSFHLGLRDGDRYIDPAPVLGVLVGRPRLIPTDGRAANPAPAPRLTCTGVADPSPAVRSRWVGMRPAGDSISERFTVR